ncbi:AMP-binding protein [Pseudokineococcus basanitobsidens]|uniref:AMP-binding protein n=1 Tax=Pseudokineococcus basanitobsidens TaxID=1926649 RepID=A0ABU8RK27_9ACTN
MTTGSQGTGSVTAGGAWEAAHRRSLEDPDAFWLEAARSISWIRRPTRALDPAANAAEGAVLPRWFRGATLSTAYNCLDRHVVAGRGDQAAVVHHSAYTGERRTLTYAELLDQSARLAGALRALGVDRGDRVLLYLPMVPEAVVAMLACARIGAVHVVVFGGFAAAELAARVDDAQPVVVVTASCGLEPSRVVEYMPLLEAALARAEHAPAHCVVLQRPQVTADLVPGRDLTWAEVLRPGAAPPAECVEVAATDPLYVLHTSGTTGRPKGVVRDHGGHAVALAWSVRHLFGLEAGDVVLTASDVGWVVGHSYIVYGPLLAGCTTVLYEGKPVGTPDAGELWRAVEEHGVAVLFTAPTAVRAVRARDPELALAEGHDRSSLRALYLAGERLDPDTWAWAGEHLGVPVVDNWWQTETGWPIACSPRGLQELPLKPGSPSVPSPGYDVRVLDAAGREVGPGEEGALCLRLPLPPGTLVGVWGGDDGLRASALAAFPGSYVTGDGGSVDEDGYVRVLGRTDDVVNVAGHRFSAGQLEAAVIGHPDVAECAVVGVADALRGQEPRALVVLTTTATAPPQEVAAQVVQRVRDEVGAVASLRRVDVVAALPKTRSGKVLRRTLREIADGLDPAVPSTIEDRSVLEGLRHLLRR